MGKWSLCMTIHHLQEYYLSAGSLLIYDCNLRTPGRSKLPTQRTIILDFGYESSGYNPMVYLLILSHCSQPRNSTIDVVS